MADTSPKNKQSSLAQKGPEKSKKRLPRFVRWGLRFAFWLFIFVIALVPIILFSFRFSPVRSQIKKIGIQIASGFIEGRLEIGDLSGDLLTNIGLKKVRWYDRDNKILVSFENLHVEYDLPRFVRSGFTELSLDSIHLEKPYARLVKAKNGELNILDHLSILKEPKKPEPKVKPKKGAVFRIYIPQLEFHNLAVDWNFGTRLKFTDAHFKGTFSLDEQGIGIEVFKMALQSYFPRVDAHHLALRFRLKDEILSVKTFRLNFGKASHLSASKLSLHLVTKAIYAKIDSLQAAPEDIKRIASAYPIKPTIRGQLLATGSIPEPKLKSSFHFLKTRLKLKASTVLATQAFRLDLNLKQLNLRELLGNKDLDSVLSLNLKAKGKGFSANTDVKAVLKMQTSTFQKYKVYPSKIVVAMKKGAGHIVHDIRTPYATARGKGFFRLKDGKLDGALKASADLNRVGRLINVPMGGTVSLLARYKGIKWLPSVQVSNLILQKFRFPQKKPSVRVEYAKVNASLLSIKPLLVKLAVNARSIRTGGQHISRFETKLQYSLDKKIQDVLFRRLSFNFGTGLFQLDNSSTKKPTRVKLFATKIRVQRLWLRHRAEKIRVDGTFDSKMKSAPQNLRVQLKKIQIRPIIKALRIKGLQLAGVLSKLDLHFLGSFRKPNLDLILRLQKIDYSTGTKQKQSSKRKKAKRSRKRKGSKKKAKKVLRFSNIALNLDLQYKRRRLALNTQLIHQKVAALTIKAKVPLILNLAKMPKQPLLFSKPIFFQLDLPGIRPSQKDKTFIERSSYQFGWLAKMFGFPLSGRLKTQIKLSGSLRKPVLSLKTALERAYWKKLKDVAMSLQIAYAKNSLKLPQKLGLKSTWLSIQNKRLLEVSGDIPLSVSIRSKRRGGIKFIKSMSDRSMKFELRLLEQQLSSFITLLPEKLQKQLGPMRGNFKGHFLLSGKPTKPKVDFSVQLKDTSFCPWVRGMPQCYERFKTSYGIRAGQQSVQKRKSNFDKSRSLRIRKANFGLALRYRPKVLRFERQKIGRLEFEMDVKIPYKTSREVRRNKGASAFAIKLEKSWVSLDFSVNPKNLKPFFRLYDPINIDFQIPALALGWVSKNLVRTDAVKQVAGTIEARLKLKNRLSNPDLNLSLQFRDGSYLWSEEDEKKKLLDGITASVRLRLENHLANIALKVGLLERRFLESETFVKAKAGFHPKTLKSFFSFEKDKLKSFLRIHRFSLQRLAFLGSPFDKVKGDLHGYVGLEGDIACPKFTKVPDAKNLLDSYIEIENFYIGEKIRKKKKKLTLRQKFLQQSKSLSLDHFRMRFSTLKDGRSQILINMLRTLLYRIRRGKIIRKPAKQHLLVGKLLFLLPIPSKMSVREAKRRCSDWPKGKAPTALAAEIYSTGIPLSFIEAFASDMSIDGRLGMTLSIGGTLKKPKVNRGQVSILIKKLLYPAYGLELRTFRQRLKMRSKKGKQVYITRFRPSNFYLYFEQNRYRVDGRLQGSKGNPFFITGEIFHKNLLPTQLKLHLRSKGFQPMATSRYKMTLDSNIKISGSLSAPSIRGDLKIPEMLFTLAESSRKPGNYKEHGDIIVLGEDSEKRLARKKGSGKGKKKKKKLGLMHSMYMKLKVVIPRNFWVKNRDISIEAKTDDFRNLTVLIKKGFLTLGGGIELVRGELSMYGKRFLVSQGSTVGFTGQSYSVDGLGKIDPRLDVTAIYHLTLQNGTSLARRGFHKVNILLKVGGSARKPLISFEVKDSITEQRLPLDRLSILSLLLTGSTVDDLSKGEQQNLTNQAFGMFGRQVFSGVKNAISSFVPLDVLNIDYGLSREDLRLEVGKYVIPQIYLGAIVKPFPLEEESYWDGRFDWAINRKWSLELNMGQLRRNDAQLFRLSGNVFYRFKR